jgi:hypothetical protein
MEAAQARLDGYRQEASKAKPALKAIDWKTWDAKITTPGVVAQLKKDYEARNATFVPETMDNSEIVSEFRVKLDKLIAQLKSTAVVDAELAETYTPKIAASKFKAKHFYHMNKIARQKLLPGFFEMHALEKVNGLHGWEPHARKLLEGVDWIASTALLKDGGSPKLQKHPTPGFEEYWVGDLDVKGDHLRESGTIIKSFGEEQWNFIKAQTRQHEGAAAADALEAEEKEVREAGFL